MITEADTCRKYVLPKLIDAGWDNEPHSFTEQKSFTDGRIMVVGNSAKRRPQKRADYLLRYRRDFTIAVVEAKAAYKLSGDGLQQAKEYAEMLGLKFAYSTNGHGIVEFDYLMGKESTLDKFPTPDELFGRLNSKIQLDTDSLGKLLTPYNSTGKTPRYYQELAINRTVEEILKGKSRILLTMATGTGKTDVAFQICWKLWSSGWTRKGEHGRPKILYLSDRNVLVDDPKDKTFSAFGDARDKIVNGEVSKGREIYFAIYQAIASDERRPGLYKEFDKDFFDLVIVDECHRGSANEESNWHEILDYFSPAYKLGLTATPLREDNKDTYKYFGNPIYTYSLKQGIEDGFLAPYKVHRIVTTYDAVGWRPSKGELDRFKREIPDKEYHTEDFEKLVALKARTEAIAKHLTGFMKRTDRFAKTMVFCVDQEHALEMREALTNLNSDLAAEHPDYVCRVTADEGSTGRAHLDKFKEVDSDSPVILTTSQMLTTGINAPTCRNIVIARVINSMTDFKQIIGRGTRVRDDYGKFYFNIIDYTGSATRLFADPDFDGEPALITEEEIDDDGEVVKSDYPIEEPEHKEFKEGSEETGTSLADDSEGKRRKYYYDGGQVEIASEMVYELDGDGKQIRVVKYTDYTADSVRTLFPSVMELRKKWAHPSSRSEIIERLEERGIDFESLAEVTKQPEADPFDLLCYVAFNSPLRTRRERAERVRRERKEFFEKYGMEARGILEELLEKYAEHGTTQFAIPDILKVRPISTHGNEIEISNKFGGALKLREAVNELQSILYAA